MSLANESLDKLATDQLRRKLAETKIQLRRYQDDLDYCKRAVRQHMLAQAGGDPKKIGANKEEREDAFEDAYRSGEQGEFMACLNGSRAMQDQIDLLTAELEGRMDAARHDRLIADDRRTDCIFGYLAILEKARRVEPEDEALAGDLLQSMGVPS